MVTLKHTFISTNTIKERNEKKNETNSVPIVRDQNEN